MELSAKKLLIYVRVSTEDQAEKGYSIEGQLQACRVKAHELGYSEAEIGIFQDDVSGATLNRPGLSRIRNLVKSPMKPQVIVMFDPDRFSRNLTHQLLLTDEILKNGVKLEFVNFEWKNTPEGIMYYQLRGIFAQYEREKIRERTMRGRLIKLQNYGKLSFDPRLFGYVFDTETDVLKLSDKESRTVKLIFQLAAKGKSGEEIARILARSGIPAPRGNRWYGSTVTRILKNRSYLGTYMAYKTDNHDGYKRKRPESEQIPVFVEPIISQELFDRAQRTIEKNRTRTGRPPARSYLLSGIGCCFCGRSIVVNGSSANRRYAYYTCSTKTKTSYDAGSGKPAERCSGKNLNTDAVDQAVWLEIQGLLLEMESAMQQWQLRKPQQSLLQPNDSRTMELEIITNHLQELTSQADKLLDLYLAGRIEISHFSGKKAEIDQMSGLLAARIEQINADISSDRENAAQSKRSNTPVCATAALSNISSLKKKSIIEKVVNKIIFQADGSLTVVIKQDFAAYIQNRDTFNNQNYK